MNKRIQISVVIYLRTTAFSHKHDLRRAPRPRRVQETQNNIMSGLSGEKIVADAITYMHKLDNSSDEKKFANYDPVCQYFAQFIANYDNTNREHAYDIAKRIDAEQYVEVCDKKCAEQYDQAAQTAHEIVEKATRECEALRDKYIQVCANSDEMIGKVTRERDALRAECQNLSDTNNELVADITKLSEQNAALSAENAAQKSTIDAYAGSFGQNGSESSETPRSVFSSRQTMPPNVTTMPTYVTKTASSDAIVRANGNVATGLQEMLNRFGAAGGVDPSRRIESSFAETRTMTLDVAKGSHTTIVNRSTTNDTFVDGKKVVVETKTGSTITDKTTACNADDILHQSDLLTRGEQTTVAPFGHRASTTALGAPMGTTDSSHNAQTIQAVKNQHDDEVFTVRRFQ